MNPDLYEAHLETSCEPKIKTLEQRQIESLQHRMIQVEYELAALRNFLSKAATRPIVEAHDED